VRDTTFPASFPVVAGSVVDYSEEQKQQAFRAAYPLLQTVYGPGMRNAPPEAISGDSLVRLIVQPDNEQVIADNYFFFSADPEPGRKRLASALQQDLQEGFGRLHSQSPSASRLMIHEMAMDLLVSPHSATVSALEFSPDGKSLIVLTEVNGMLYQMDSLDAAPILFDRKESSTTYGGYLRYCDCKFTPDGRYLQVDCGTSTPLLGYSAHILATEFREGKTGALLKIQENPGSYQDETGEMYCVGPERRDAYLHGGDTLLTIRGRYMRFYRMAEMQEADSPDLSFALRMRISHFAVSPDGETIATATDRFVILWRIPPAALSLENRQL